MRSAEPIQAWGSSPFANQKIRLCSRNRPRMLRTVIRLRQARHPGRIAQIPRISRSTGTPAWDAR